MTLIILAIVFCALQLSIGNIFFVKKGRRLPALILGIVAVVFCFIVPLFFSAAMPGAVNEDTGGDHIGPGPWKSFEGATREPGSERVWGPLEGWSLAFISPFLALFSVALYMKRSSAPSTQTAPLPFYYPSPQPYWVAGPQQYQCLAPPQAPQAPQPPPPQPLQSPQSSITPPGNGTGKF